MMAVFSGTLREFSIFCSDMKDADIGDPPVKISWPSQLVTAKPYRVLFVGTWSMNPSSAAVMAKCTELGIQIVEIHPSLV